MRKQIIIYLLILLLFNYSYAQIDQNNDSGYRIMFYNVENYFDAEYDSSLAYNEFTPTGDLSWTYWKYSKKRDNIYKVIKAVGGWNPVTLIGLAEVENEFVILDLINSTPLNREKYNYIHYESADFRGIDVSLIYDSSNFIVLHSQKVEIHDPSNPSFTTRDMLYVKGLLGIDTLHVIVNHWTSRYRGYLESEPYRILAAHRLLVLTDSICKINNEANIILMGDFNDNPENNSIKLITNANNCGFTNMELISTNKEVKGTLKYRSTWSHFDQIIISEAIVTGRNGITSSTKGHIYDADFLLEHDNKFLGLKTNRTNIGFKYHGGFSDHLPIYIDLSISNVAR